MIIGSRLEYFENLPSTNTQASSLVKDCKPIEGTVIFTDYQTAGKGQPGNTWESEKGKNLLFSIILYPEMVKPQDQFLLTMAISLGIISFLDIYLDGSTIKWPNDIYIGNDKIAGILIENSVTGTIIGSTIAGIGININQVSFPETLPNPVSLKLATGSDYEPGRCLTELLNQLDNKYIQVLYGNRKSLKDEYISRLFRLNKWHTFRSRGKIFTGRITGVGKYGKLIIEKKNGQKSRFSFKEVDYLF